MATYTPQNEFVFIQAFTGAVAGLVGQSTSFPLARGSYDTAVDIAGAWAQEVDIQWAISFGTQPDLFEFNEILTFSEDHFQGTVPQQNSGVAGVGSSANPATYTKLAQALMTVLADGEEYLSNHEIPVPSIPVQMRETYISLLDLGCKFDDVTDDSAAFQEAVYTYAGTGVWLVCPGGRTALFAESNVILPKGSLITGYNSRIRTTIGAGNVYTNTIFSSFDPRLNTTTPSTTALNGDVTAGTRTVVVTSLAGSHGGVIAVDSMILLRTNNYFKGSQYIVKNIAGGGPFTLTLDRNVGYSYAAASSTVELTTGIVDGIHIEGLTFTGVAQQYVELLISWRAVVKDCTFDTSGGALAGTFGFNIDSDSLSFGTYFRNLYVDGGGLAQQGIGIEEGEKCVLDHCFVENTAAEAYVMFTSYDINVQSCSSSNNPFGFLIGSGGDPSGCLACSFRGGVQQGASIAGMDIGFGSSQIAVSGMAANDCANGFLVDAISSNAADIDFEGCTANRSTTRGFWLDSGAGGTIDRVTFEGCKAINGGNNGFDVDGTHGPIRDTKFANCQASGNANTGLSSDGTTNPLNVTGTQVVNFTSTGNGGHDIDWTCDLHVRGLKTSGAGLIPVQIAAAAGFAPGLTIVLDDVDINCSTAGAAYGIYLYNVTNGKVSGKVTSTVLGGITCGMVLDLVNVDSVYTENFKLVATTAIAVGVGFAGNGDMLVVGPGCDFDQAVVPFDHPVAVKMHQRGSVAQPTLVSAGNVNMKFTECYSQAIEADGALGGDSTITPLAIPGLQFVLRNDTTGGHNVGLKLTSTVNVAAGKSAIIRVTAAADVQRVTADT